MPQRITGSTRLLGIIANPIRHSKSPMMHNTAFEALGLDYVYTAFEVRPRDLARAVEGLKALGVVGFNVSMPYKRDIIPLLDGISEVSRLCGSVNTVVNREGKLWGTVTDGIGWMRSVEEAGFDLKGQKLTLLGGGGAATAIAVQAALDGVAEIRIFNRRGPSHSRAQALADTIGAESGCVVRACLLKDERALAGALGDSALVCNATGVGMGALEGQSLITDPALLRPELICADVIYAPEETAFLKLARQVGCPTLNGLGMVLYQGAESFRLWTGLEMPIDAVRAVL